MSAADPQNPQPPQPPAPEYRPFDGYEPFQEGRPAPSPQPARGRGLMGGLMSILFGIWAIVKWGGLLLFKFKILGTLVTMLVSFGLYAFALGPIAALGIVVMLFVHEMGHVVEIRRQGMPASAPLFIPFMGAAIFQRSHPTDALRQAEIGIAGPIAGTVASIAALALYGSTGWKFLLAWAWFGFFVNLFNMIPFGMLDGGWILAAASKWFQVAGLGLMAIAVLFFHLTFSPVLIILLIVGIPTMIQRFRDDRLPYYRTVPVAGRFIMGFAWLGLVAILGFGLMQTAQLISPIQ